MRSSRALLLAIPVVLAACDEPTSEQGRSRSPATAADAAPIINGTADTENPAAVWLFDTQGAACTGTIVKVDGTTGYVLTAAHCADIDIVAIATDYYDCFSDPPGPECQAVFQVHDQVYHPEWNGDVSTPDFSMLRFVGPGPDTPVVPAASSNDGVARFVDIEVVGFGQTETGDNSLRKHKLTVVNDVYDDLFSTPATVCYGDSGGPAFLGGYVVGVSSFVDDTACRGQGYSGRVQSVYEDFIAPYLAQPPIVQTCDECLETAFLTAGGPCGPAMDACRADLACATAAECVLGCVGDPNCIGHCSRLHVEGFLLYDAIRVCAECDVCDEPCGECTNPAATVSVAVATVSTGAGDPTDGAGGGGGSGGSASDDDVAATDDGCAVGAVGAPSNGLALAAALALALAARRRAVTSA